MSEDPSLDGMDRQWEFDLYLLRLAPDLDERLGVPPAAPPPAAAEPPDAGEGEG